MSAALSNSISSSRSTKRLWKTTFFSTPKSRASACRDSAVRFALLADDVGMRGADDQEHHVGKPLDDLRQGLDDGLDPLAPAQQAEGQEDRLALDAEIVLVGVRIGERNVVDAVRDQIDLAGRRPDTVRRATPSPSWLITTTRSERSRISPSTFCCVGLGR